MTIGRNCKINIEVELSAKVYWEIKMVSLLNVLLFFYIIVQTIACKGSAYIGLAHMGIYLDNIS